jgi:hypothetical protein
MTSTIIECMSTRKLAYVLIVLLSMQVLKKWKPAIVKYSVKKRMPVVQSKQWYQSFDHDLQRQRCKTLQRHE